MIKISLGSRLSLMQNQILLWLPKKNLSVSKKEGIILNLVKENERSKLVNLLPRNVVQETHFFSKKNTRMIEVVLVGGHS